MEIVSDWATSHMITNKGSMRAAWGLNLHLAKVRTAREFAWTIRLFPSHEHLSASPYIAIRWNPLHTHFELSSCGSVGTIVGMPRVCSRGRPRRHAFVTARPLPFTLKVVRVKRSPDSAWPGAHALSGGRVAEQVVHKFPFVDVALLLIWVLIFGRIVSVHRRYLTILPIH